MMVSILQKQIKGQSGLELIVLTTFLLLVFSTTYVVFIQKDINTITEKINRLSKKTTNNVAFEIRVALSEGNGYEKNFTLPNSFVGMPYIVNITNYMVYININDRSFISYIPTKNITGYIIPGKNILYNAGGKIYANT
ncbi:hypothetical protein GQ473_05965 [archaeon]|nr:hypothetical protein [archaeon]